MDSALEIKHHLVQMQLFVRTALRALHAADEESFGDVVAETEAVLEAALGSYHAAMEPLEVLVDKALQ